MAAQLFSPPDVADGLLHHSVGRGLYKQLKNQENSNFLETTTRVIGFLSYDSPPLASDWPLVHVN
jgi:hypothetical protein